MKLLLTAIAVALALTACQAEPDDGVNLDGEPPCEVTSNGKPACGGAVSLGVNFTSGLWAEYAPGVLVVLDPEDDR